jgi:hypothetical protein
MYNEYALLPPTVSDSLVALDGVSLPPAPPGPSYARSLPWPDWS